MAKSPIRTSDRAFDFLRTNDRPPKPRAHDCFRRSAGGEPGGCLGDRTVVRGPVHWVWEWTLAFA